ncbi:NAD binding domain of 6-phosphogluconate dehydrogenase-domain-containing protein [Mariannaea sp. PMI_226]|nr:NAD binding domain of 6-phosphogluconate dehydrogenase-domain-containing protein [Mariannaea sp. PMI_226]
MDSRNESSNRIGIVGLGVIGQAIASQLLLKQLYSIVGYDDNLLRQESFVARGGKTGKSPRDVAKMADIFICTASGCEQIDDIMFHEQKGAAKDLITEAVVLICSTVRPDYHTVLRKRMDLLGRSDVFILDCPVSAGTGSGEQSLTIFVSGVTEGLERGDGLIKDISEHARYIPGGSGIASKVSMVNQLLIRIHTATAAEAIAFATHAGLDIQEVYDIITKPAAGDSWIFENRVPRMMDGDWTPYSTIDDSINDMELVMSTSRSLQFPLPILSAVEQLYILASAQGYGAEDDAAIVRIFTPGESHSNKKTPRTVESEDKPSQNGDFEPIINVGFIGLGAMGYGMAMSLVRAGYSVTAYDVYRPSIDKFIKSGKNAKGAMSASEAVAEADLIVMMVQSAAQAENVLFGTDNAIESVPNGAVILLSCTVPSSYAADLAARLAALGKGISLVDAPVSGGAARAATGQLMFICSGNDQAISDINKPLLAMAGTPSNVCRVRGGAGAASSVKMINQLLAGVHIVAAAEAMAFAFRLGIDLPMVFDVLKKEAGWSWMLENRVPQILSSDWTPFSALAIFVKDMGIVMSEAKRLHSFAPISSVAYTLYLEGAAKGFMKEADIGVFRLWPLTVKPNEPSR